MSHDADPIPHAVFSVGDVAPGERFALWKESISCIFDVEAEREVRRESFDATVDAYMLGQVLLARTTTLEQTWRRSASTIARDGMDHYMIQLFTSGGMEADYRGGAASMDEQGLIVFDLSQDVVSRTGTFSNISLIIPRDMLAGMLKSPDDQHMRTLAATEPMVALLRDHMMSLHRLGSRMSAAQAAEIGPASATLAAACLNGAAQGLHGGPQAVSFARMTAIKRTIEENLADPVLSAEKIGRMVGVSRSKLYTMFESHGGVADYVRERRLRRAMLALVNPRHDHRPIYDIALASGFVSESGFSRSFRRRFGCSPREVRRHRSAFGSLTAQGSGPDRRYEHWLSHLSI